jgi:RNA polymerase sigma-70 factor, ECF subfamily
LLATLTADTETNLINQAQRGDRSAFGELVRRHYTEVVRVVYRLCGDTALSEDATQEAFLRAWVKLPTFQAGSPLRNWLFRIAVNAALDALRKRPEERLEEEQGLQVPDQAPSPESVLLGKEQAAVVQGAIESLPEAARSVLVLREYGDLSYQEISSVLDIPVGTVMSRLNYARGRLRGELKPYFSHTEGENV